MAFTKEYSAPLGRPMHLILPRNTCERRESVGIMRQLVFCSFSQVCSQASFGIKWVILAFFCLGWLRPSQASQLRYCFCPPRPILLRLGHDKPDKCRRVPGIVLSWS